MQCKMIKYLLVFYKCYYNKFIIKQVIVLCISISSITIYIIIICKHTVQLIYHISYIYILKANP